MRTWERSPQIFRERWPHCEYCDGAVNRSKAHNQAGADSRACLDDPDNYRLIEDGMTEMDDVLKDRLNSLKADRDRAKAALERAKSHSSQAIRIDPALLEQFGRSMRENFTSGSIPFRKVHLQSLIDVIEVDDTQIRIKGSKDVLETAVLASRNGAIPGSQMSAEWRARRDSNS
jgi:site-specific DNA recombinase